MSSLFLGSSSEAFASGGNRLCFVDPRDHRRCIKVLRPDRLPEQKKISQSFPRSLKPRKYFDDNWQEWRVYRRIDRAIGESAYQLIPRCYEFVETNYGAGLVTDIITDVDGRISLSLKQILWQWGQTPQLMQLIESFIDQWSALGMPSRNLLLHNIVVRCTESGPERLYVIDGLGWPDLVPFGYWFKTIASRKARRKAMRLYPAMASLEVNKNNGKGWGFHGWLNEDQRQISNSVNSSSYLKQGK